MIYITVLKGWLWADGYIFDYFWPFLCKMKNIYENSFSQIEQMSSSSPAGYGHHFQKVISRNFQETISGNVCQLHTLSLVNEVSRKTFMGAQMVPFMVNFFNLYFSFKVGAVRSLLLLYSSLTLQLHIKQIILMSN